MNSDIREALLNMHQNSGQMKQQFSLCDTGKLASGNKAAVNLCVLAGKKSPSTSPRLLFLLL